MRPWSAIFLTFKERTIKGVRDSRRRIRPSLDGDEQVRWPRHDKDPCPLIIRGCVLLRFDAIRRFGLCRGSEPSAFRDLIPDANAGEKHLHSESCDRTNSA